MPAEILKLSPYKQYCHQVLGISEILIPENHCLETQPISSSAPTAINQTVKKDPLVQISSWAWQGDERASFFTYMPELTSDELKALWQKILVAFKNPPVIYLQGKGSKKDLVQFLQQFSATKGLIFGQQWAEQLGIGHFKLGHSCQYARVEWKMTYSLADLLGTAHGVSKKKKEAWGHMQEVIL